MAGTHKPETFDTLDEGTVEEYVEHRLFDGKIDSLEPHIARKKALADPFRYSILYLLYEYGRISRKLLADETGRESNDLHHHLRDLLDANLIAQIPAPEDADGRQTYYRITTLGRQEIASDIEHIVGGYASEEYHQILGDPELIEGMTEGTRLRPTITVEEGEPSALQNRQSGLRSRRANFQEVESER